MHEAGRILIDLHPGVEQLAVVSLGEGEGELLVRYVRQNELHVHAALGRERERHDHRLVEDEVRRHDAHIALGVVEDVEIHALAHTLVVERAVGIRQDVAARARQRAQGHIEIAAVGIGVRLALVHAPHLQEHERERAHGLALETHGRVLPHAVDAHEIGIFIGEVHAAGEADAPVDDGDLGVVAPVGARREPWEPQRRVGAHLDSCAAEPPHEPFGKFPRTDGVVEQPHLHAGTRLADEDVGDGVADAVVGEDVVGEMDVAAGTLQGGDQRGEGFAAVVELFHAVAVADARRTAVPQHPLDAGRRPAVGGRHVPHGFAVSRQQVEQAAADRQKHDGQQPCDRYYGRLLLPQYGCRRGDCQQEICGEEKIHDQGRFLVRGILCAKKYLEIKKLLFIFV